MFMHLHMSIQYYFVWWGFQDLFKIAESMLVYFPSNHFSMCFVRWRIDTEVLIQSKLGRNTVYFIRDQISTSSKNSGNH